MDNPGVQEAAREEWLPKRDTQIWPVLAPLHSWLQALQSNTSSFLMEYLVTLLENCIRKDLDHRCPIKFDTSCV